MTARVSGKGIRKRRRPPTWGDVMRLGHARQYLEDARTALREAGAHHSAAYVARALKSVKGAQNHAVGRLTSNR